MMTTRRIVYPLFFVVVLALIVIPSVPKAYASNPIYAGTTTASGGSSGTVSFQITNVVQGDFIGILAQASGSGVANGFTMTDSFGDAYTPLYTGTSFTCTNPSAGLGTASCSAFTQTISGGTITITVTETNGFMNGPIVFADRYTNVASTRSPTIRSPCPSGSNCTAHSGTDTFSPALVLSTNEIAWETASVLGNSATGPSGITANSGQTLISSQSSLTVLISKSFQSNTCNSSCPSISWTTDASAFNAFVDHGAVILQGPGGNPSNLGSITACYGNCGSPAVTLVNTNSTHSINFNISQTLFYEFQSNLNGFILNETVNVAKTYTNGQQVGLGIYTASCTSGVTPFTSACPGQQRAVTISNPNIPKGKFSLIPSLLPVTIGQWVGIAVTAINSGIDLNDTNTVVPLFIQSPGTIPPLLNNGASFGSCSCKMGMWAYIVGNTINIPSTPIPSQGCGADVVCFMTASACGLTPSNCLIGALAFGLIYSFFSIILIEAVSAKIGNNMTIPGGIYVLTFMGWMTFWSLIVGAIWFVILEILAVVIIFSAFFGSLASGQFRHSGRGGRDA